MCAAGLPQIHTIISPVVICPVCPQYPNTESPILAADLPSIQTVEHPVIICPVIGFGCLWQTHTPEKVSPILAAGGMSTSSKINII
jgi:hypothetical protein